MNVALVRENTFEIMAACPFCRVGGATLNVYQHIAKRGYVRKFCVICDNCDARGSLAFDEVEAIARWNAAPQPAAQADIAPGDDGK